MARTPASGSVWWVALMGAVWSGPHSELARRLSPRSTCTPTHGCSPPVAAAIQRTPSRVPSANTSSSSNRRASGGVPRDVGSSPGPMVTVFSGTSPVATTATATDAATTTAAAAAHAQRLRRLDRSRFASDGRGGTSSLEASSCSARRTRSSTFTMAPPAAHGADPTRGTDGS